MGIFFNANQARQSHVSTTWPQTHFAQLFSDVSEIAAQAKKHRLAVVRGILKFPRQWETTYRDSSKYTLHRFNLPYCLIVWGHLPT